MGPDQVVELSRLVMREVLALAAPVLAAATVVSVTVSLVQAVTSLQDNTLSTVARLLAAGAAVAFTLPRCLRHLVSFTVMLLGDMHRYTR